MGNRPIIGRLFGADNRPKHYRCTSTRNKLKQRTSVAGRGFNQSVSRLKPTTHLGIIHHAVTNAVFNTASGIQKLALCHYQQIHAHTLTHAIHIIRMCKLGKKVKKGKGVYSSLWEPITEVQSITCHIGSDIYPATRQR